MGNTHDDVNKFLLIWITELYSKRGHKSKNCHFNIPGAWKMNIFIISDHNLMNPCGPLSTRSKIQCSELENEILPILLFFHFWWKLILTLGWISLFNIMGRFFSFWPHFMYHNGVKLCVYNFVWHCGTGVIVFFG